MDETLILRQEEAVLFAEISAPPMNLLGPELVRNLVDLIQQAEGDEVIKVIVFTSADPDYFIAHVDLTRIAEYRAEAAVGGHPTSGLASMGGRSRSRPVHNRQVRIPSSTTSTCVSPGSAGPARQVGQPSRDQRMDGDEHKETCQVATGNPPATRPA